MIDNNIKSENKEDEQTKPEDSTEYEIVEDDLKMNITGELI